MFGRLKSKKKSYGCVLIPTIEHLIITLTTQTIAAHYAFSPRLLGLMCSDPMKPVPAAAIAPHSRMQDFLHRRRDVPRRSMQDHVQDLEGHIELGESPSLAQGVLDLNHYHIINEVWHYFSVDWGHNCGDLFELAPSLHSTNSCQISVPVIILFIIFTCRLLLRP